MKNISTKTQKNRNFLFFSLIILRLKNSFKRPTFILFRLLLFVSKATIPILVTGLSGQERRWLMVSVASNGHDVSLVQPHLNILSLLLPTRTRSQFRVRQTDHGRPLPGGKLSVYFFCHRIPQTIMRLAQWWVALQLQPAMSS